MTTGTDKLLSDLAAMHSLDLESLEAIVDILGDHRLEGPHVEGEWMVWKLMVSERTMEKRFLKLKRAYPASFMRSGRVGVNLKHLRK
jgi:hypothetical protein